MSTMKSRGSIRNNLRNNEQQSHLPKNRSAPLAETAESVASGKDADVLIAVMGATGAGKSTFINLVSGSNLPVGEGLKSCTSRVGISETFELSGRSVTLFDTPGFDDTNLSDTDILKMIAVFLSITYKSGRKLSGVIYMHRISDFRVGGIAKRNFGMFRKLCGDDSLKNVVVVTNMWSEVDVVRGEAREHELRTDPDLFKPVLDKGATMLRHQNSYESARAILQRIVNNTPQPLRIQEELVDEGKTILQTAAGEALNQEIVSLLKKHEKALAEVREEMKEALAEKDLVMKQELEEVTEKLTKHIAKLEDDRDRLAREYEEERRKAEARLVEVETMLAEERKLRQQRQSELDMLKKMIRESARTAAADREVRERRIEELLAQQNKGGVIHRIARHLESVFS